MTPEAGPAGALSKMELFKKMIADFFHKQKVKEDMEKAAKKAQREREGYESKEERAEEERRQEARDAERAYHQARSADVKDVAAGLERQRRATEVKAKIDGVLNGAEKPGGSGYLINALADTDLVDALKEVVSRSPSAAEAVNSLLSKGTELHGSARELIQLAQRLSYDADKAGLLDDLTPLFHAIGIRAEALLDNELEMSKKLAHRHRQEGPKSIAELLEQEEGIVGVEGLKSQLESENQVERLRAVESLIIETARGRDETKIDLGRTTVTPNTQMVASSIIAPIDDIRGEIERVEATGKLSVEKLEGFAKRINEEESRAYPHDVPPQSEAFKKAMQLVRQTANGLRNELAKKLSERLIQELPKPKGGITDTERFLEEVILSKGRLGGLLDRDNNPEMYKLFVGTTTESRKFRDKVFLKIHTAVLSDRRNGTDKNFSLYERADFTTFVELVRVALGKIRDKESGQILGQVWSDHYNNLSNTILQCRDIDFWASQPGATAENWNKSLGMFQNEYLKTALDIPAVNAAFRAYETSLRHIMTLNDGYIPPALIEYDPSNSRAYWDDQAQNMLESMISMGSIPDVRRTEYGFYEVDKDGHSVSMDFENPLKLGDLSQEEKMMYMMLAKGVGIATARYLEMFSQARIPGSRNPTMGMDRFHSTPYEGVAKALNYFNIFINKWKIGSYKYFYLMNMLVPDGKNKMSIDRNDSTAGIRAFMDYQRHDGTFEKTYGDKAKRFIDMTNFSNISSAIGKDTLWRQYDSTADWSDKMKELLGGPTRLALSGRYAGEAVKEFLVIGKYREQYRQALIAENEKNPSLHLPVHGAAFDKYWKEYGRAKFQSLIDREWDELNGKDPKKGIMHTPLAEKTHHLTEAFGTAFKARVWVEMAMRNPLVVAHQLKVDMPLVGVEGDKKMSLHNILVQEILGIPPEDTKYGEEYGIAAEKKTPDKRQLAYMQNVMVLEGDLAAVREIAINHGRDLTEGDFDMIKDNARRGFALEYWKRVRQVVLGETGMDRARELYKKFGLEVLGNSEDYAWNYDQIHKIEKTLEELKEHGQAVEFKTQDGRKFEVHNLLEKAVGTEWEWILGTDDMAFNRMDILDLGSRQLLRRGGDIASHEAGGNAVTDYFLHGLNGNPDKHALGEALVKLRDAYAGDMIEAGWSVGGNLAYMTDRLYAWDWKRMGSAAQLDVWKTRRGIAAWMANERREWWDILEHSDVLPPDGHFYFYDTTSPNPMANIHSMREACHATNRDVWREIFALAALLALAITVWRGFRAKEEGKEEH